MATIGTTVSDQGSGFTSGYVGNPDFRGYLDYSAQNYGNAPWGALLNVVGGDYTGSGSSGLNLDALSKYIAPAVNGANAKGTYWTSQDQALNDIQGGYQDYLKNVYNPLVNAQKQAGTGTGVQTTAVDPTATQDLAYLSNYDQQLNRQLGSSKTGLANGLKQIGDSYNEQYNRTNQDQTTADTGYNTQRDQTTQGKQSALDTIYSGANTLANSVRRILGLSGGSNSSAYQFAAPSAIAKDTTAKTTGVANTYKNNYDAIDTAQQGTDLKFTRALADLLDQRKQKESDLNSGILTQQQSIEQQLEQNALMRAQITGGNVPAALAPYSQQIADRQNQLDDLFNKYRTPYSMQDTNPIAANTATYATPTTNIGSSSNAPSNPVDDNASLLASLLKKFNPSVA